MSHFSLTVEIDSLCFTVEGEYTPGEPPSLIELDGDVGHPGTDSEIEIESVVAFIGDEDSGEQVGVPAGSILDFAEKWDDLEEKVTQVLNNRKSWDRDSFQESEY